MSADPLKAIRSVVLADEAVAALVSTRVYGMEIGQPAVLDAMPQAAIVITPAGGPSHPGGGFQKYGKSRFDVFCYGATLGESYAVYLAVYDALKQMRTQISEDVLLHSAESSSKGVSAKDPVTQWPTTLSSWLVLAAETT